ncbi:MAG TPA: hypothetical protein VIF32_10300 [Gemmatimonadaceae bacterium]
MIHRPRVIRYLVFILGALQLAAPGVSAIADGMLSRDESQAPATHIEATTRSTCQVVHSPDCGLCRYLSLSAASSRCAQPVTWQGAARDRVDPASTDTASIGTQTVSLGRAPPRA